ncbi:MAG TPA: hypothetical protein VN368_02090, partial [Candidatus Methylomirabilis sp.]|nr:hypothetical protein [Candidatus Methylomirabilis sp.]
MKKVCEFSSELNLLLYLVGDIYKNPSVIIPENIDWDRFLRLAARNKVLYYALLKLTENCPVPLDPEMEKTIFTIKERGDIQYYQFCNTLKAVN